MLNLIIYSGKAGMKIVNFIPKSLVAALVVLLIISIPFNAGADESGEEQESLQLLREAYGFYQKVIQDPGILVAPMPQPSLPLWMDRKNAIESIKMAYLEDLSQTGNTFDENELSKRVSVFEAASNAEKNRLREELKGVQADIAGMEAKLGPSAGAFRHGI